VASGEATLPAVISLADLRSLIDGNWVAFDVEGRTVEYKVPKDIGPAALSVSSVTDALKVVGEDGNLVGSVDKASYWSVDAIVLNVVVLDRLHGSSYTAEDLIEEVRSVGFSWQISPTSGL
jgi:hypothetical protein